MIELLFDIDPVPCPRPSVRRDGRVYYKGKYDQFKKNMAILLLKSKTAQVLSGPLKMKVWFSMPIPKSWSQKKTGNQLGKLHAQRPDLDNLVKSVKDALQGKAYHDDSQIADMWAEKRWKRRGGIRVDIETTEEE